MDEFDPTLRLDESVASGASTALCAPSSREAYHISLTAGLLGTPAANAVHRQVHENACTCLLDWKVLSQLMVGRASRGVAHHRI
jgi:hypothetical protein